MKSIVIKKKVPAHKTVVLAKTETVLNTNPPDSVKAVELKLEPVKDKELAAALSRVRQSIESQGLDKPETKEIPMSDATQTTAKKAVVIKKKTAAAAKPEKTKRADGFTAGDMAKEVGVSPAELRKALRGAKVKKPGASWTWDSKSAASDAISKVKAFLKDDKPAKKK